MNVRNWMATGVLHVLVAWGAQPVLAADYLKVAMMDQQQVIERSVAGKRALEELKSYSTTRQKIIDSDDQELKELEKGMQDASMSEEARKEKQDHFRTKLEAYQRRIQDFNREVQEMMQDSEIRRRLDRDAFQTRRMSAEELQRFFVAETERWSPVAKALSASAK